MQQFQVPQFITVEDKVIGPFTIKQFLYVAAGALLIIGMYLTLESFLFFPLAILIGSLASSLAFLKINEQPLPAVIKNALFYFLRPRLYIWKKEIPRAEKPQEKAKKEEAVVSRIPTLSESKLSDLAWSLDIKERIKE